MVSIGRSGTSIDLPSKQKTRTLSPKGVILVLLLLSLISGLSGALVREGLVNMYGSIKNNEMQYYLFLYAAYIAACLCMARYYRWLHLRRGLLISAGMLFAAWCLLFILDNSTEPAGVLIIAEVLLSVFGSVWCSLLVMSAIANHYFRTHRFLVIGCCAAVLQSAYSVIELLGQLFGGYFAIVAIICICAVILILCLKYLPDMDITDDAYTVKAVPDKVRVFAMLMIGMLMIGLTARVLLNMGSATYESSGMNVQYILQDLAAMLGSILFGYLADRCRIRRILLIYCAIGLLSAVIACVGGPVFVVHIGRGFGFAVLYLISPAAATISTDEGYDLRVAGRVEAAYHAGIIINLLLIGLPSDPSLLIYIIYILFAAGSMLLYFGFGAMSKAPQRDPMKNADTLPLLSETLDIPARD